MGKPVPPRKRRRVAALLACGLGLARAAAAAPLELSIERVEAPWGAIEGLQLELTPEDAQRGRLELRVASLEAGAAGYRFRNLRWRCALSRDAAAGRYDCEGEVRAKGAGKARLAAQWQDGRLDLALSGAQGRLALAFGGATAPRLLAEKLPVAWLAPLLQARWPDATLTGGTLDAQLVLQDAAPDGRTLDGSLALDGLGFDTRDGRHAAAGLGWSGTLALGFAPGSTAVELRGELRGGEVLAGPVYATLPPTPVTVGLKLAAGDGGDWALQDLVFRDPGVLDAQASGRFDPAAEAPLRELDATLASDDLSAAHARYLDTLLAGAGLARSRLQGSARARVEWRGGQWHDVHLTLGEAAIADGAGRFEFDGLAGDLRWTAGDAARTSALQWRHAALYGLPVGPAPLALDSRGRSLSLSAPATLALLGGRLELSRLAWRPAEAARGAALDLGLSLADIDLGQLSTAFGWPAFEGTLGGRLPAARYEDEVLRLEGGLEADLFDGRVRVASLELERPFGVAPTLGADIAFERLDLQPLTAAFGFGEITGRLDGAISGLRLVDWAPVAFEADLHSTPNAKGPRRISRRAVNDLSRVGGGGLAAGLQAQVLKLFDTFGYARIGLKCRLSEDVCHMDGLDSSGPGYVIVEGSGLPRITVIGHQRQVDWPVLVARLKAATEGQTPIVR